MFEINFRLFNTIDRKQVNKGLIQIFRQLGVEPGVALTISALEVVAQTTELFFHSKYLANVSQEIKVSREKSCSTFAWSEIKVSLNKSLKEKFSHFTARCRRRRHYMFRRSFSSLKYGFNYKWFLFLRHVMCRGNICWGQVQWLAR